MDVTKDGVRIEGEFGELFGTGYFPGVYDYEDFFVANFPFDVVNDQVIPASQHLMALAFRNLYIFHRKWRLAHHKKVGLWDSLRNPARIDQTTN